MLTYFINGCLLFHRHIGINWLGSVSQDLRIITTFNCLKQQKEKEGESHYHNFGHCLLINREFLKLNTTIVTFVIDFSACPCNSSYTSRWKQWVSNLSAYLLVLWCTYSMNETLIYQQACKVVLEAKF